MKKIEFTYFTIFGVLLTLNAFGQENMLRPDTIKCEDAKLKSITIVEPILTLTIDFTGDNKLDFICRIESDNKDKGEIKELWIDHDYKIIKTIYRWASDYDYYWFVNLDSDPEPEICSIFGDSDGINYAFYDQNLKDGIDNLIFFFNPIIIDTTQEKQIYWGYPWDIKDIKIKKESGTVKILNSIDHDIKRNGEIEQPSNQSILPVICFTGKSSQPNVKFGEIRKITWMSIDELKNEVIH